jgi:LacI family transcriptional regulator
MSRRVTIADVAASAGVHSGTASRALSSKTEHQVNVDTVKRVKKAAKELGYIPNVMARGLRISSSMTIGVIIPDLTNPLFPPIIRGIEDYLSPRGYTALLANTDGRPFLEKQAFDSLLERRVEGFILATGLDDHPLLQEAYDSNIKVVMVNRGSGAVPYPLVAGDDAAGIEAAVRHLVELGHRHIVHIAGPANFSTTRVRADAFLRACAERSGIEGRIVRAVALSVDAGEDAMNELLREPNREFTAVMAANDLLALGTLRALRAHGVACPDEVSVIGYNDMPFAEDFNPALTTVHVPQQEIGWESARLLLESIEKGTQSSVTVTMPVSLIVRSSTARAKQPAVTPARD